MCVYVCGWREGGKGGGREGKRERGREGRREEGVEDRGRIGQCIRDLRDYWKKLD